MLLESTILGTCRNVPISASSGASSQEEGASEGFRQVGGLRRRAPVVQTHRPEQMARVSYLCRAEDCPPDDKPWLVSS
eukprot:4451145-Prymnesium_polylepis.1